MVLTIRPEPGLPALEAAFGAKDGPRLRSIELSPWARARCASSCSPFSGRAPPTKSSAPRRPVPRATRSSWSNASPP